MLKNRVVFLFICFVFIQPSAFSQYFVKNYFNISGKKDVAFNCVTQDKKGYLWAGTNEGIIKFDGKNTIVFKKENGVSDSKITAIYADSYNTIWAGTEDGNVYFISPNEKVDSVVFTKDKPTNKITSFYVTENKKVFISTYGDGIYVYQDKQTEHITAEKGLSDDVIYSMVFINRYLWCGTDAGITYITNIESNPVYNTISNKDGLPDNIVRNISSYKNDNIIISMQDSGVCLLNLKTDKFERFPFFNNWSHGAVVNVVPYNKNSFAIATEKNGLFFIKNGRFYIQDYFATIQTSSISYLFKDNANNFWLASPKGLHLFYEKRFDYINSSKGLPNEKILSVITDKNNCIWAGTEAGLYIIMKDSAGRLVFQAQKDLAKLTISHAAVAPDGNIWFATYSNGIIVLNPITKKTISINSKTSKLPNDNISTIYFSKNNSAYISTLGGGLIEAEANCDNGFIIKNTFSEKDGLGSNYIYSSITDNEGRLYTASDGGGLELFENGKFISLTSKLKINSNTVISLCKDAKGNIWATSNTNGLLKYDGENIKSITQRNGLRDEQPQQLIAYENIIFAIHSKGIDKIDCITDSISYYDVFDGDLEPNLNSACIDNGVIYSGTNNGVLIYRVAQLSGDTIKPNALINRLLVNYKPFPLDSTTEFKHNMNNFSFDFSGIWLKAPDKLNFRFKLIGQEENWNYSNEGKVFPYPNLNAGDYTFVVQAVNEEGVWSNEAKYSFTILLPIWKRWWFWLIVIIFLGSAIYFFIQYRIKALQKENIILEEKVNERTKEIEKQTKIIEAANKELEQLSLVASKTDNVVMILDAKGKLEYVNESFVRHNKISLNELKKYGETIYEVSNNPNIKHLVEDAINNKRSVKYESMSKIDGEEFWAASTLTPIFEENGKVKKIIIIDSDVTETKLQQKIIEQKNKDITDSIEYARKIQTAILPADQLIKQTVPDSFVLYRTKDIVSGDFYWFNEKDNCSIIAAVDCTGHGVPGAFMSLIGYNILNRIVGEQNITDPGEILKQLNIGVLDALYKNQSNVESKDGMDIAICKIYHNKKSIEYAGAMRPLWIVNGSELQEIKADKVPIGTIAKDGEEINYTTHTIKTKKGDVFYIFTDGYVDQFGGEKGKKLTSTKLKQSLISYHTLDFKTQREILLKEHDNWKGYNEQVDDILVIGFKPSHHNKS